MEDRFLPPPAPGYGPLSDRAPLTHERGPVAIGDVCFCGLGPVEHHSDQVWTICGDCPDEVFIRVNEIKLEASLISCQIALYFQVTPPQFYGNFFELLPRVNNMALTLFDNQFSVHWGQFFTVPYIFKALHTLTIDARIKSDVCGLPRCPHPSLLTTIRVIGYQDVYDQLCPIHKHGSRG